MLFPMVLLLGVLRSRGVAPCSYLQSWGNDALIPHGSHYSSSLCKNHRYQRDGDTYPRSEQRVYFPSLSAVPYTKRTKEAACHPLNAHSCGVGAMAGVRIETTCIYRDTVVAVPREDRNEELS